VLYAFDGRSADGHNVIRQYRLNDGRPQRLCVSTLERGKGVSDIEIDHNQITLSAADSGTPRAVGSRMAQRREVHDNVLTTTEKWPEPSRSAMCET